MFGNVTRAGAPTGLVGVAVVGEDAVVEGEIRYARNGGVAIAYQVVGEGEVDLVYVADFVSNLVYGWEYRAGARSTSASPARSD